MNQLTDNKPKGNQSPNIPNRGVRSGVTDTYGANLDKGTKGTSRIPTTSDRKSLDAC